MSITAVMLMGAKCEPFLGACLASIRDAVDHLIVNDNSGLTEHLNLSTMQASDLYRAGRVTIVPSAFLGFGPCRDLCLDEMRKTDEPGRWVIFVDCDEVHVPAISRVTKGLLPRLPERIGIVDGYFYQIFQSPRLLKSLDHRHNLMFRFHPDIHWTGQVQEKLAGLTGKRLVIPYRYFHYGYLEPPAVIADKWRFYGSLGDPRSGRQSEAAGEFMQQELQGLLRFYGDHPAPALGPIRDYERDNGDWLNQIAELTGRQALFAAKSRLRFLQIAAKMRYLLFQATRRLTDCPEAQAELTVS